MKKIRAKLIGWDLDGTLADNFDDHYKAMCVIFEKFNAPFPSKEEYSGKMSHNLIDFYHQYDLPINESDIRQIFREFIEIFPLPQMFTGAKETLETIRSKNIEQALITMASE